MSLMRQYNLAFNKRITFRYAREIIARQLLLRRFFCILFSTDIRFPRFVSIRRRIMCGFTFSEDQFNTV